jgi:hypothetical protein
VSTFCCVCLKEFVLLFYWILSADPLPDFQFIFCCRYGSPALAFGREIIAFRAKHNEEDWKRVDIMLGGNGTVPSMMHANDASKKQIPVNNKTISEQGHLNMCRALCHEIQVYKQLMTAAINLNEEDTLESLRELNCPDDMTPEVRSCPQNYFDYFVE